MLDFKSDDTVLLYYFVIFQVGSFIMDNDIDDEDQDIEPKFLLPTEGLEASNIPSIDPETHARLEALLEAAGKNCLSSLGFYSKLVRSSLDYRVLTPFRSF